MQLEYYVPTVYAILIFYTLLHVIHGSHSASENKFQQKWQLYKLEALYIVILHTLP